MTQRSAASNAPVHTTRSAGFALLRRFARLVLVLALLVGGGAYGWIWWQARQAAVFVQDARVAADMITLSAAADAYLEGLAVGTGDQVSLGQPLARQDARELELKIGELSDDLASMAAERVRIIAQRRLVAVQAASRIEMARATISMAQAEQRAASTTSTQSSSELNRAQKLFKRGVISSQEVEDAKSDSDQASERTRQAQAAVMQASAGLVAAQVELKSLAVLDAEIGILDARKRALLSRQAQLKVQRERRDIAATINGVVDRTFVEQGEYLRVGTRVLMLHDPTKVWIALNVKETELSRFAVGATARVRIDAFPGRELLGKVTWIASAATNQFALLPNPNPSGNFTKVTQRVPVRIDLRAVSADLRPGMMAEVAIDAGHN